MYADYCTNYESAANAVVKLKQSHTAATQIIERGQIASHGLDLVDFLIMPVQRKHIHLLYLSIYSSIPFICFSL